ncbi:MAG: NADH-quinone oxidoreductase subunit C [Candidatus Micrarchaeia archaeon]
MKVESKVLLKTAEEMKNKGFSYLVKITAVDNISSLVVLYFLRNIDTGEEETLEVELHPVDASIPSIMHIYKAADWYERELKEMFGIEITGRNAPRLLLEKWNGIEPPLRKNFEWGKPYKAMD